MTITGTDGRKMSKSYDNVVPILSPPDELRRAVMSIVTDSRAPTDPKDPDECNVFNLYRHVAAADDVDDMAAPLSRRRRRLPRSEGSTLSTRSSTSSARRAPATKSSCRTRDRSIRCSNGERSAHEPVRVRCSTQCARGRTAARRRRGFTAPLALSASHAAVNRGYVQSGTAP